LREAKMIESVSVTPVYNDRGDPEAKKLTGFGIFIKCGIDDADEIFNLLKNMTFTESGDENEA
jgi:hypothetical protein